MASIAMLNNQGATWGKGMHPSQPRSLPGTVGSALGLPQTRQASATFHSSSTGFMEVPWDVGTKRYLKCTIINY